MPRVVNGYPLPPGAQSAEDYYRARGGYVRDDGYPLELSSGCPNCKRSAGWVDEGAAASLERPCSRACALQIEYATELRGKEPVR